MRLRLFMIPLVVCLLGMQEPRNPDDYVGPEDPAHEGQPKSCTNVEHVEAVEHDCKCEKTTKGACAPDSRMEDSKCYVYCRKPACKCVHPVCGT